LNKLLVITALSFILTMNVQATNLYDDNECSAVNKGIDLDDFRLNRPPDFLIKKFGSLENAGENIQQELEKHSFAISISQKR
jgi:hypothetical protein